MLVSLTLNSGRLLSHAQQGCLQDLWRQYDTFAPRSPEDHALRPDNFRFFRHWPDNFYALLYDPNKTEKAVATLTIVPEITCRTSAARLKDIIVEKDFRGQGYRKMLIAEVLSWLQLHPSFHYAEIPSHPSRETANRQYEEMGFQLVSQGLTRDAPNIYRKIVFLE